jgi:hypothetical protein
MTQEKEEHDTIHYNPPWLIVNIAAYQLMDRHTAYRINNVS